MSAANRDFIVSHTIRYDDLSAASDMALESALIDLLLKYRVPCTFAATPFVCDPQSLLEAGEVRLRPFPEEKARLFQPLLAEGLAEIALHGYAHLLLSDRRRQREFCDRMPVETQRALIRKGRTHLEAVFGTSVRLFVPPWNNLDRSTMEVLKEEGLAVSAEFAGGAINPMSEAPFAVSIGQTRAALLTARRLARGPSAVGTVIHDYDFHTVAENPDGLTLNGFEKTLCSWLDVRQIRRQLVSDAVGEQGGDSSRACNNTSLQAALHTSRVAQKLMHRTGLVYWDCLTARRLARWALCLP